MQSNAASKTETILPLAGLILSVPLASLIGDIFYQAMIVVLLIPDVLSIGFYPYAKAVFFTTFAGAIYLAMGGSHGKPNYPMAACFGAAIPLLDSAHETISQFLNGWTSTPDPLKIYLSAVIAMPLLMLLVALVWCGSRNKPALADDEACNDARQGAS